MQRPTSVTVASWVIIALALEAVDGFLSSMIRNTLLSQIADPHVGLGFTALLGSFAQLAIILSAAFMLRGANWARITYVVLTGVTLLGMIVIQTRTPGLGVVAFYTAIKAAVLLYVLFRPEANAYFSGAANIGVSPGVTDVRQTDA
jgi:hypothetical protein